MTFNSSSTWFGAPDWTGESLVSWVSTYFSAMGVNRGASDVNKSTLFKNESSNLMRMSWPALVIIWITRLYYSLWKLTPTRIANYLLWNRYTHRILRCSPILDMGAEFCTCEESKRYLTGFHDRRTFEWCNHGSSRWWRRPSNVSNYAMTPLHWIAGCTTFQRPALKVVSAEPSSLSNLIHPSLN